MSADGKRGEGRGRSSPDIQPEDFLFHLYRGSELLQDDRVHEAKEELEAALRLQPRDAKGQDLLAVVYFRLGMYPRAIEIFQDLVRAHPGERTPRVNLALCFLKTGQPALARELLEDTVQRHPDNARAWGYLGLAYERLGDYQKAREAFLRGGQRGMARRMEQVLGAPVDPSAPPPPPSEAFEELGDEDEILEEARSAPLPSVAPPPPPTGTVPPPPPSLPPPPVSLGATRPSLFPRPAQAAAWPLAASPAAAADAPLAGEQEGPEADRRATPTLEAFAREVQLPLAPPGTASAHPSGALRIGVARALACRMASVRATLAPARGGFSFEVLLRRARGRTSEEPLGGSFAPLVMLSGIGGVVVGPRVGRKLASFLVDGEAVFLREEAVLAFEDGLAYECGRLALGDGESTPLLQLRGRGLAVVETNGDVSAYEATASHDVIVPGDTVVGWTGRVAPRALTASEAPAAHRGLVLFSGEGLVLIEPRA